MANLETFAGSDGLRNITTQNTLMLLVTLFLFFVVAELWIFCVKTQNKLGSQSSFMIRFWPVFLLVPLFAIVTRLLGLDLWSAAFQNPYPTLAAMATSGMDATITPQNIRYDDLNNGLKTMVQGRAGQTILPALVIYFFLWKTIKKEFPKFKTQPETKDYVFMGSVVLIACILFPQIANPAAWSALIGNTDEFLEQIYSQEIRLQL